MSKTIEIPDIAQYEESDSELAKYTIQKLSSELRISQTNEETYRLEMQDITKCLGLDEHTIFDEVKEKATNLQEEIERLNNEVKTLLKENGNKEKVIIKQNNIIDELENFIETYAIPEFNLSEEPTRYFMETKIILDKLKELKEGK